MAGNFEALNTFTGATLANTNCCQPPDTQLAVSPTRETEAVNNTVFVYDRGGNQLGSFSPVALMALNHPNNSGTDPKIIYDAAQDRWFMTMMICQNGGCGGSSWTTMGVDLAVSSSGDPLGNWIIYQNIYSGNPWNDTSNNQDQPKLGFSDDKVTVSDNVYTGHSGCGCNFKGEYLTTYQMSDLIAGVTAHYVGFTSGYAFDSIPAIPTPTAGGSDSTQYVAWQGYGSLGVDQITGTPNGGDVNNSNTQSPAIGSMTATVAAPGVPAVSDNNVESVAWEGNTLWATSSDGCGSPTQDCVRLDEIDTSNASSLSVLLDQNINAGGGTFLIYPSVTQSCRGEVHFGATYSDNAGNSTSLPSALDIGTPTPGSGYVGERFLIGDTSYTGSRWGDYSATVQDPADCGNVWTAQEYGAVSSGGNWATGIGQFSFDSPSVGSISPQSGPATGGTTVDIFGADFVNGGTSVSFGGTPASVTFIDSGHIQALSPSGSGGPVDVTATTSNGTSFTFSGDQFSWIPAVTGVNPTAGPTSGGNSVDISGAGFNGATGVSFGSTAAAFSVNNDGDITATAPAGSAGTVDVTVSGPTGTSSPSFADEYTYDAPPTVSRVGPTAGPLAGGNTVTVTGTNFAPGSTVTFGSTAATVLSLVSGTQLRVRAPGHPSGIVDVTVTNPGGSSAHSHFDWYTYGPPTVTSFTPTSAITGTTVTINGTNFALGAGVKFGTSAARSVTFVSGRQLRAILPPGSATGKVAVTTAAGTGTSAANLTVTLSITGFTPASGPTGTLVTINGAGFNASTKVKFHGVAATGVTLVSSHQLKAHVPAAATTGLMSVTNTSAPVGTVASAGNFTKT